MQVESFVTRLARQQVDSDHKPGRNEEKKSSKVTPRQLSLVSTASTEGIVREQNHNHDSTSSLGPGKKTTHSEKQTEVLERAEEVLERAEEDYHHMIALQVAAESPHNEKHGHSLAKDRHAHSTPKRSDSEKAHAARTMHQGSSGQTRTAHPNKGNLKHHPKKKADSPDTKNANTELKHRKAGKHKKEDDDEYFTHRLHARVQKKSHKKRETHKKKEKSHSLLNPAILTVMFLMSAPAGMLLLAFGSLLWAKSHHDASMGGGQ
jgi:hypothetical protein